METASVRLVRAMERQGRSIRSLQMALHEKGVPGSSYANVHAILKKPDRPPPLAFLREAASELDVRFVWLATGEGGMTEVEDQVLTEVEDQILTEAAVEARREPDGREVLGTEILRRFPAFSLLGAQAQALFLRVLVGYALTSPDGATLTKSEDGLDRLLELAGDLLAYVRLPWHPLSGGFVSMGSEAHERQIERFTLAVLIALDGLLVARGRGQPVEAAEGSLLRQVRDAVPDVLS